MEAFWAEEEIEIATEHDDVPRCVKWFIYVDSQDGSWEEWFNANAEIKLFSQAAENRIKEFMLS